MSFSSGWGIQPGDHGSVRQAFESAAGCRGDEGEEVGGVRVMMGVAEGLGFVDSNEKPRQPEPTGWWVDHR
jgi:hypothetical protein